MTVSGLCMHDFGARASAPWKIFCCLLKFLLKNFYKCRVGLKKSESRGVGWLIQEHINKGATLLFRLHAFSMHADFSVVVHAVPLLSTDRVQAAQPISARACIQLASRVRACIMHVDSG